MARTFTTIREATTKRKHKKRVLDEDHKTLGVKILSKLCRYIDPDKYEHFMKWDSLSTITELHEMKEYKNQYDILLDAHALLIFREFRMNGRFGAIRKLAKKLDRNDSDSDSDSDGGYSS